VRAAKRSVPGDRDALPRQLSNAPPTSLRRCGTAPGAFPLPEASGGRIPITSPNLRKTLVWAWLLLAASSWSLAQEGQVVHNVNLRRDPSTNNPPIRLLTPPEVVTLIEPDRTDGYYHVQTDQGEEGWVWSHNVQVIATTPTPVPTHATTTPTVAAATTTPTLIPGPATAIDPTWAKGTPAEITFSTPSGTCSPPSATCGPDGDTSGDPETNHLKNRVDVPSGNQYREVTFDAITNLAIPHVHTTRKAWTAADRALAAAQITPFEGVAVSVVGFLVNDHPNVGIKVETTEKTNCRCTGPAEVDWHLPLAPAAGQLEETSIVVEVTPRVRKDHPNWTTARLNPLFHTGTPVRISGWLMFDPDHPPHLGVFRATLWEIHPITRIEVQQGGVWKSLDEP
jgi:hypothetical protein